MKSLDSWLELGVRFVDRHIEKENFSGRMSVVETVAECVSEWEGADILYRYGVHWLVDDDSLEIKHYDKLVANDAAARVASKNGRISIPSKLWRKMRSMAEQFLNTEGVREDLSSLHEIRLERDPGNDTHIVATFRTRRWSGYRMVFRERDGYIQLIESSNRRILSREHARVGHKRMPQSLCNATYDLVSEYVKGQHTSKNNRQAELEFAPQNASD